MKPGVVVVAPDKVLRESYGKRWAHSSLYQVLREKNNAGGAFMNLTRDSPTLHLWCQGK